MAWVCDVPLPPCSQSCLFSHPPHLPVPLLLLLTCATCNGMALPALPSVLMRRVLNGAPIFPPLLGTLCSLTTSSTHSLSALRLSRPYTNQADLMLPSLTTNSLLLSPSATSLRQVRTASHTHFEVASSSAFLLQPGLALRCGSVHLEVQLSCSGQQA